MWQLSLILIQVFMKGVDDLKKQGVILLTVVLFAMLFILPKVQVLDLANNTVVRENNTLTINGEEVEEVLNVKRKGNKAVVTAIVDRPIIEGGKSKNWFIKENITLNKMNDDEYNALLTFLDYEKTK